MELSQWAHNPIPPAEEEDYSGVLPPEECGEPLLDVTERHPRIRFDASYRRQGYRQAWDRCYLRQGLWSRLVRAAEALPQGYSLLIFDGLRPLALQKEIYDRFARQLLERQPDLTPQALAAAMDDFVALPVKRPRRPAPHTTGGAVDLTLCRDGAPLDMGTGFDDFTSRAHTDWFERPGADEAVRQNRRILYHLMAWAGLRNYSPEWWHYAYGERMWARITGRPPMYGFCPCCDFPHG
ncbi:M15 family metallopeptidase [Pseudoflavonifractor phocaeensis]|uniref:M15 family metallopeptidase n=1 Tax=Pseudoflavonifractor phocaeensis TaxID=1870988 RepID=UPI001958781B|nr:M15 family metallopeptidase [Pseudoflavonifractor phocaeensis]MBM6937432.1 M15 family metallopeptidase [Pseudoflavonifractor phocaeensis]